MHRFYLPPEQCADVTLRLTDREAHHAAQVLRLQVGDRVAVLDGAGHEFHCEATQVARREVLLRVVEENFHPPLPARLTLVQAIPKGKTFDVIVQKATELGAHRVVPLLTERVVTRFDEARDAAHKIDKWRQVAIESIKQCGSPWMPEITPPTTLVQSLTSETRPEMSLVAALAGERHHLRRHFARFHDEQRRLPATITVWVGPEGDFTPKELADLLAHGVLPITLGTNVLRAETAAIYCLAVLGYELQANATETA